jgi:hypothetical protein
MKDDLELKYRLVKILFWFLNPQQTDMKYDKIIGILWHWDPLTEQGLSYDERLVRQSSGSMLALVQHLRPFKDIKADFIQSVAQLVSGGKFIGLIHRDSLSVDLHRELYLSIQNSLPDNTHYNRKYLVGGMTTYIMM